MHFDNKRTRFTNICFNANLASYETQSPSTVVIEHAIIFKLQHSIKKFPVHNRRMFRPSFTVLLLSIHIVLVHSKMMRNEALISKMVSDFQMDNVSPPEPPAARPGNVIALMQNVLCRNFPTIPCDMITDDDKLRKLIEKSVQQIRYKKLNTDKTAPQPGSHLTLFPALNSEDLSNFLQESETGYYKYKHEKERHKKHPKKSKTVKLTVTTQKQVINKVDNPRSSVYSHKKIRKFYPHKIKYKDKRNKVVRKDFGDYSEEKLSMSVEMPDMTDGKRLRYRTEPEDPPVWRIDYMKHGDPSINSMFGYEAKLVKSGPNGAMDDGVVEHRKDVLHPDVYIKKNFVRKNSVDSDDID